MEFVERKRTRLFGLPWTFTRYTVDENKVTIKTGFLSIVEDDAYMYKIQDVRLIRSFLDRINKTGTVICYTGDITHPELKLQHIKHSADIKDFLRKASEEARLKRRTLHTMDIANGAEFDDVDDIDIMQ